MKDKFILPAIIDRKWTLEECLNKEFMRTLAQSIGLNTPQSWVVDCSEEVNLPQELIYPCVVKAIDSSSSPKNYTIHQSERSLLESINELSKYCDIVQIQEFIFKKRRSYFWVE